MIYEILKVSAAYRSRSVARVPCLGAVPAGWSSALQRGSLGNSAGGKVRGPPEGLEHTEQEGTSKGAATDGWHGHCCCLCTHEEGFQGCPAPTRCDSELRMCFSGVFFRLHHLGVSSFLKALHCLEWLGKDSPNTKIQILMCFSFSPADRMAEACPLSRLARNLLN